MGSLENRRKMYFAEPFQCWTALLSGRRIMGRKPAIPITLSAPRKGSFQFFLMCYSDRRFLWYDISCTTSTHDSLAWHSTALTQNIITGHLSDPFFVLEASAFTTTIEMITHGEDDKYNLEKSSMRRNI